jgi:hypothetical protein
MTKGLKVWLYICISGVLLGCALLFSAGAQAADNTPKPETTTSTTEKANGDTVINKTEVAPAAASAPSDWFAPGGILTVSIGGIFLIVREYKGIKQMDIQGHKDRADAADAKALAAETKATAVTDRLSAQIERLEKKLDDALADVETKHDEWLVEVAHRRKLEILLAQNGISVADPVLIAVPVEG